MNDEISYQSSLKGKKSLKKKETYLSRKPISIALKNDLKGKTYSEQQKILSPDNQVYRVMKKDNNNEQTKVQCKMEHGVQKKEVTDNVNIKIKSLLYAPTPGWRIGMRIPLPPKNFPNVPTYIKENPASYLKWLADVERTNPDPECQIYARIKFKVEYFARQKEINQMGVAADIQVDEANAGIANLDAVQFACQIGMTLCGIASTAQLLVLGVRVLGPALLQWLNNFGGPRLAIAIAGGGSISLVGSGGAVIALTQTQILALIENGIISISSLEASKQLHLLRKAKGRGGGEPKSPNQMNKEIQTGKAPNGVTRVDTPKVPGEKTHVHFEGKENLALNKDGTWKHGKITLSDAQKIWLQQNGWSLP